MSQAPSNATQARSVLRDAIHCGLYPHGSTLPSTRDFAAQFGINRNTATKIYHELAKEQLIELVPNRPPIVSAKPRSSPSATLRDRVRQSLNRVLIECRLVGLTADDTRRMLLEIADEFFSSYRPYSLYVAECNDEEARAYAQELTLKLGVVVQPTLLGQLHPGFEADMIVTPYFHFVEARDSLGADRGNLTGMVVTAEGSDIARVASNVSTGPLGVVAFHLHAAERLKSLLSFQIDVPMLVGATEQPSTLEAMRGQVEYVACTVRSFAAARSSLPGTPIVLIQYHVDDQSVELLRRDIQRLGMSQPVADSRMSSEAASS